MRLNKETLDLEVPLTDKEKIAYGKTVAEMQLKIRQSENHLKAYRDSINSEISTAESVIYELSRKLDSGTEFRPVECNIERDFISKTRRWIRTDTFQVAKEDIIPEHELQEELKLQNEKENGE